MVMIYIFLWRGADLSFQKKYEKINPGSSLKNIWKIIYAEINDSRKDKEN
jgi:hypothetical protein